MRCKACNAQLNLSVGSQNTDDVAEYCWNCQYKSTQEYNIHDHEYVHADSCSVPLDGSTLFLAEYITHEEDEK